MLNYLQSIRGFIGPMIDAMPCPIFLVDKNVAIVGLNRSSQDFVGTEAKLYLRQPAGNILHCIHSEETKKGCGYSRFCKDCIIRNSVNKAFETNLVSKNKVKMEVVSGSRVERIMVSIITSPFECDGDSFVILQLENITELMELRELVPICSVCHDIRTDDQYWHKIETYLNKHLNVRCSHSICPECSEKTYGKEDWFIQMKNRAHKMKNNDSTE